MRDGEHRCGAGAPSEAGCRASVGTAAALARAPPRPSCRAILSAAAALHALPGAGLPRVRGHRCCPTHLDTMGRMSQPIRAARQRTGACRASRREPAGAPPKAARQRERRAPTAPSRSGRTRTCPSCSAPLTALALHAGARDSLALSRGQVGGPPDDILRAIFEELRELRESVRELHTGRSSSAPASVVRAVSLEAAQTLLGCGRSRIFDLLRCGALRRAPKLGKEAMINLASVEALLDSLHHEPAPKHKRPPPQRDMGREEKEAILKLIRKQA